MEALKASRHRSQQTAEASLRGTAGKLWLRTKREAREVPTAEVGAAHGLGGAGGNARALPAGYARYDG